VVVIDVVEGPPRVPLSEGKSLVGDDGPERALRAETTEYLETADVPVESQ
jgi:hypothetical protein